MFKEELILANNIYDIMAIAYIHTDKNENFNNFVQDNEFKPLLSRYLETNIYEPCTAFKSLKNELYDLYCYKPFSKIDCFNLLIEIDSYIVYDYKSSSFLNDSFKTYTSLNLLHTDKIRIYPVLLTNYRENLDEKYKEEYKNNYLRKRKSFDNLSINCILNNYIIYIPNKYSNYNVIIHELTDYEDFIYSIYHKSTINIALFPITSINIHQLLNIEYTNGKQFSINAMNDKIEKYIIDRCGSFIESLDDIDFLIFPEMLMTESIIESIKVETIKKGIKFVFCGSIWENGNNICRVLYEGEEIFQYYKKIPFDLKYSEEEFKNIINNCSDNQQLHILNSLFNNHIFEKNEQIIFQEKLKSENNVHIIDINNFGRIMTYICKDIDDDCYMNIPKILQSDFIFLPACTPSTDLKSSAVIFSERYHCATIMCNTCSSLCKNELSLKSRIKNKNHIGFITTPSKDNTERSHKINYYNFNENCSNCNNNCKGRIFTINIEELLCEDACVSLNVKEISR